MMMVVHSWAAATSLREKINPVHRFPNFGAMVELQDEVVGFDNPCEITKRMTKNAKNIASPDGRKVVSDRDIALE